MIAEFTGRYRFLSNFYPSLVELPDQPGSGIYYPTVEHAYQAAKTLDHSERGVFWTLATPSEAKRRGRRLRLRADWEEIKLAVMHGLLRQKFGEFTDLRQQLLATGDVELIEGNYWGDRYWGVCRGVGANHLGRLLMKVREEARTGHRGGPYETQSQGQSEGGKK